MQRDNIEEMKIEGEVPLSYKEVGSADMGDLTSLWTPFGRGWRK
jgi:hypothetical protein